MPLPPVPFAGGVRSESALPRARLGLWLGVGAALALLCASAALAFWGSSWLTPPPGLGFGADAAGPRARIYVVIERDPNSPSPDSDRILQSGDLLHVAITGTPGTFTTLLNLGSDDRLVLLSPPDVAIGRDVAPISRKFRADDVEGHELLLVVAASTPLGDLTPLIQRINDAGQLDRTGRLARLRTELAQAFGPSVWQLHAAPELWHTRGTAPR